MRKAVMLWTIPGFLAVWSAVGADLYVQGYFDETEQLNQVTEVVEVVDAPQVATLVGIAGD